MRTALFGLMVTVGALLACGGSSIKRAAGGVAVIECRDGADCYNAAVVACPYGYDTQQATRPKGQLVVKCRKPVFCTQQDCADGLRCVKSKRYPGRAVCALR